VCPRALITDQKVTYTNTAVSRKVVQQKRTRQYRKVLRVIGFLVINWGFRIFSDIERNSANKCIYTFSFLVGKHSWTSINERQTRSTHNTNWHCRVRFYAFVGQPLSKQLYTKKSWIVRICPGVGKKSRLVIVFYDFKTSKLKFTNKFDRLELFLEPLFNRWNDWTAPYKNSMESARMKFKVNKSRSCSQSLRVI